MGRQSETTYTYSDYEKWDDGNRWELIDGVPYMMSPAPSPRHQEISTNLVILLGIYLKGKTCKVYAAPFDVRLNADSGYDTVVQPDISVICDPGKIDECGCKGAPDMVVEILSPATRKHDTSVKLKKYLEAGVREYWIVDQEDRTVFVYALQSGTYMLRVYEDTQSVPVGIFEDCIIDLAEVFPVVESPSEADAEQERPGTAQEAAD